MADSDSGSDPESASNASEDEGAASEDGSNSSDDEADEDYIVGLHPAGLVFGPGGMEHPDDEDDLSLPIYNPDNRHSYLYADTGPVTFVNSLMCLLNDGQELNKILTTFRSHPLNIGDEMPYLKLDENDNRAIRMAIQDDSYLISINVEDEDSYEIACWLRDRSNANETSLFSKVDAVVLQVISHATKEDKWIAVCRAVGKFRISRVEKSLTGLIFSNGTVVIPNSLPSFEASTLSKLELGLSQTNREGTLQHLLSVNSKLFMQCATSASIDRIFSALIWISNDFLAKMRKKPLWKISTFLMRALPIDRKLYCVLNANSCVDAQISILDSIDYSTVFGICNSCDYELFNMKDMIFLKPWVSSAVFVNPGEYVFDTVVVRNSIVPFSRGFNDSFSWFSGYGWGFATCLCSAHLGWLFESKIHRPMKFCAIRKDTYFLRSEEITKILDQYYHPDMSPSKFFRRQIELSQTN